MKHATVTKTEESSHEQIKTMVIISFDSRGVVHKEFVPPDVTVNQNNYLEVLGRMGKRAMQFEWKL
jgi:hypothetical protein